MPAKEVSTRVPPNEEGSGVGPSLSVHSLLDSTPLPEEEGGTCVKTDEKGMIQTGPERSVKTQVRLRE